MSLLRGMMMYVELGWESVNLFLVASPLMSVKRECVISLLEYFECVRDGRTCCGQRKPEISSCWENISFLYFCYFRWLGSVILSLINYWFSWNFLFCICEAFS